jgi:hypothetical protein
MPNPLIKIFVTVLAIVWCLLISQLSYKVGYQEGQKDVDWKTRLLEDPETTGKACTLWWFNMNTLDRRINPPKKSCK